MGKKLMHSVAAHVADSKMLPEPLRGNDQAVWGDQAPLRPEVREANRVKSKLGSCVEHVIGVLKLHFRFVKVCYRGLAKNLHRPQVSFALMNLVTAPPLLSITDLLDFPSKL